MQSGAQRGAVPGCHTFDVIRLETRVTEPRPISAAGDDRLVAQYDARFAAARDRLVRVCAALVGTDAAEDIVHDAYLRGRSRFAQLRDLDLFESWLTRLAVNLCVNRSRRTRRLRDLVPELVGRLRGTRSAPRDAGVVELIEGLSPRERTIIVLHYGYGYQLDEIARMAGLTSGNVRSIAFRARRRLADQLREADR
jgi:RNA polymerase sigma-70 factor (ECF subfamily)